MQHPGEAVRGRWEVEVTMTKTRAKIGSYGLRQEAEDTLLVTFLLASGEPGQPVMIPEERTFRNVKKKSSQGSLYSEKSKTRGIGIKCTTACKRHSSPY